MGAFFQDVTKFLNAEQYEMYDTHCNSMYNSTGVAEGLWRPGCARGDTCGEGIVVGIDIEDDVAFISPLGCQGSPGKVPEKNRAEFLVD